MVIFPEAPTSLNHAVQGAALHRLVWGAADVGLDKGSGIEPWGQVSTGIRSVTDF